MSQNPPPSTEDTPVNFRQNQAFFQGVAAGATKVPVPRAPSLVAAGAKKTPGVSPMNSPGRWTQGGSAPATPTQQPTGPSARVFVFEEPDGAGVAISVQAAWPIEQLCEIITQKLRLATPATRLFYPNGAMITDCIDLRDGDELYLVNLRAKPAAAAAAAAAPPVVVAPQPVVQQPTPVVAPQPTHVEPVVVQQQLAPEPTPEPARTPSPAPVVARAPSPAPVPVPAPAPVVEEPRPVSPAPVVAAAPVSPRPLPQPPVSPKAAEPAPAPTPAPQPAPTQPVVEAPPPPLTIIEDDDDEPTPAPAVTQPAPEPQPQPIVESPKPVVAPSPPAPVTIVDDDDSASETAPQEDDKSVSESEPEPEQPDPVKAATPATPVAASTAGTASPARSASPAGDAKKKVGLKLKGSAGSPVAKRTAKSSSSAPAKAPAKPTAAAPTSATPTATTTASPSKYVSRSRKISAAEVKKIKERFQATQRHPRLRGISYARTDDAAYAMRVEEKQDAAVGRVCNKLQGASTEFKLNASELSVRRIGSRQRRTTCDEDVLRALVLRAKSLPDLKIFPVLQGIRAPRSSPAAKAPSASAVLPDGSVAAGESMGAGSAASSDAAMTSTLDSSTNSDDDEEKAAAEKEFKKLEKQMFNLTDESSNQQINPLLLTEEEVEKRMKVEEKQDLENVDVDAETGHVKAGTLRALVRRLTSHLQDPEFVDAFLLTYDLFIDPVTLFKSLIMLFRAPLLTEENIMQMTAPASPAMRRTSSSNLAASLGPTLSGSPPTGSPLERKNSGMLGRRDSLTKTDVPPAVQAERQRVVIQFRIITVLKKWIEWRYEKIKKNRAWMALLDEFCAWLKKGSNDKMRSWSDMVARTVKDTRKLRSNLKKQLERLKVPSVGSFSGRMESATIQKLTDIPPEELARQLTLTEQEIFLNIQISEYTNLNFSRKDKDRKAPHLVAMINRFNRISFWVATCVVLALGTDGSPKARAQLIGHFIATMEELKAIRNYMGMMQIFSALNMSSVSRMHRSWALLPARYKASLDDVGQLLLSNYKGYREMLEYADPPCIPIQEVICRDLTFIEENPNIHPNGWVNFEKMLLLGKTFKNLKRFQSQQYDFQVAFQVQLWMNAQIILTDSELFDHSKRVEPPPGEGSPARKSFSLGSGRANTPEKRPSTDDVKGALSSPKLSNSSSSNAPAIPPSKTAPVLSKKITIESSDEDDDDDDDDDVTPAKPAKPAAAKAPPAGAAKKRSEAFSLREMLAALDDMEPPPAPTSGKKEEKKKQKEKKVKLKLDFNFDNLLSDRELYQHFLRYLMSIHAQEILAFYRFVMQDWKKYNFSDESKSNQSSIASYASNLYNTYISLTSPQSIAVPEGQRLLIEKAVKGGNKAQLTERLFDGVLGDITFQLKGHFAAFKKAHSK
eukprot:TRINITY_DN3004_c0_g1_i1.p1 TRINITY_DN3004_c0_g1~~TRINITY_DN3004_c0_g1_i1.p1  ORF type:complete len:1409 (+),score=444.51 TRINITY_DN3004_c0_g1_i1:268-4494(+)